MDEAKTYRRADKVAWRRLEDEVVLMDLSGQKLRGLNDVAGRIWELLDGKCSNSEIAEQIAQEFKVSSVQAEKDVEQFISELLEKKLIEPVDSSKVESGE